MNRISITESASPYDHLDRMSITELLEAINTEDHKVALAVQQALPAVTSFLEGLLPRFQRGGRLFYLGAGTSGRLGVLDASEIPPTYGLPPDRIIGIIAGGDDALRISSEKTEDDPQAAVQDLSPFGIGERDAILGISASGGAAYVLGGLAYAKKRGALTGALTNNPETPLGAAAHHEIAVIVGPEVVTGSTRMKAGTAQKMILNMISTALMIRTGRVQGNKMVHMQLTNQKLLGRGVRMLMDTRGVSEDEARQLLAKYTTVEAALRAYD